MMGCYGGSYQGTVLATNVEMTDGEVEDIFGGCYGIGMTGETNVTVTGGIVKRRIYGGCYNEHDSLGILGGTTTYKTAYYVTGNTKVTIGSGMTFKHSETDSDISALSRHSTKSDTEYGELWIENSTIDDTLRSYYGNSLMDTHGYDKLYVAGQAQQ